VAVTLARHKKPKLIIPPTEQLIHLKEEALTLRSVDIGISFSYTTLEDVFLPCVN
jgi:hypothetical protein